MQHIVSDVKEISSVFRMRCRPTFAVQNVLSKKHGNMDNGAVQKPIIQNQNKPTTAIKHRLSTNCVYNVVSLKCKRIYP